MLTEDGIRRRLLQETDLWREGRALFDLISLPLSWPLLLSAPRGDGHPVLIIPGFGGDDATYYPVRLYLALLGYRTHGWLQGRNRGPTPDLTERLAQRLRDVRREADGQQVSILGQSLGGLYARELARRYPSAVRQVITMGAPVSDPLASRIARFSRWIEDWSDLDTADSVPRPLRTHLPMPCTSIYSRSDGVVGAERAQLEETPRSQNVHIESSHIGMGFNALAYYVIADRLAQAIEDWQPFRWPAGLRCWVEPAGHTLTPAS